MGSSVRRVGVGVVAVVGAVSLVRCSSSSGGPGGGSSTSSSGGSGGGLSVPACPAPVAGYTQNPLPIQPAASWTQNVGTINPACTPSPNPAETAWFDVDGGADAGPRGVELNAASNQANCCTCTARSRAFHVGSTPVAGTHLQGAFAAARGQSDQYALASMRVTLKSAGSTIGSRVFAQETRANDNCAGSSELPETVIPQTFDVDVSPFATGGTSFDEVDVDLNGYACTNGSCEIALVCMSVATQGDGGGSPGDGGFTAPDGNPNPTTVGFIQVGCEDPANPNVHVNSGICPNGVDLSQKTTVTCRADPCTGSNCTVTGMLSATNGGQQAQADCSALKPICDTIAQTVANPQVVVADRVPCL